ncbi:UDP-2,3-diacylglucosamine diphosphatase LpxI [Pelagibacteraceae bacterium]|nr:UDP-2,3-diacylglucosamine diphosphatase LpxI [Pelagibacteraceae bacterium]
MKNKFNNLAIIGGDNHLPIHAYKSVKKKFKEFIYINISKKNKSLLKSSINTYHLEIHELERCINILKNHNISQICFLGSLNRPDFSSLKIDDTLKKYINDLINSSKIGDGNILNVIINIFDKEGFFTRSFIEVFANEYLLDKEFNKITDKDKNDINKGVSILNSLSKYDNAQSCAISNGYVLAIEAVEGTDKMISRIRSIKKKISRDLIEGCLIKIPKKNQNLKIDLPTVGVKTLEMMFKNKLNVLALRKDYTIVVEKKKFYRSLAKYNISLSFIN